MVKYVCMHCEYTWDSETGDETYKVPAGPMNTLGTLKPEMKLTKYQQDLSKTSLMTGYALNVQQVLKELSLKTNKFFVQFFFKFFIF